MTKRRRPTISSEVCSHHEGRVLAVREVDGSRPSATTKAGGISWPAQPAMIAQSALDNAPLDLTLLIVLFRRPIKTWEQRWTRRAYLVFLLRLDSVQLVRIQDLDQLRFRHAADPRTAMQGLYRALIRRETVSRAVGPAVAIVSLCVRRRSMRNGCAEHPESPAIYSCLGRCAPSTGAGYSNAHDQASAADDFFRGL
jgi:hypothetical protein